MPGLVEEEVEEEETRWWRRWCRWQRRRWRWRRRRWRRW
jgi:hypothetical protein